jgi:diketogulonate reductase-like aldo/keto reductase
MRLITMITRKFGLTGEQLPIIDQGTWMIEGDPDTESRAIETLQLGIDLGMTRIETAELYGNGGVEELVREAIAGRRDKLFMASKVLPSNASFEGTQRACVRSLKTTQDRLARPLYVALARRAPDPGNYARDGKTCQ